MMLNQTSFNYKSSMQKQGNSTNQYEVEAILGSRIRADGSKLYLIKWKHYSHKYNTWQPIQHLMAVKESVKAYQMKQFQKAVDDIKKKEYKSKKIRSRFEAMKISSLKKKMIFEVGVTEQVKPLKGKRKDSMPTLAKRKRNIQKLRKRTDLSKAKKTRNLRLSKKIQQKIIQKTISIVVSDQNVHSSQIKLVQIKQSEPSNSLVLNIQKETPKEQMKQISCQKHENNENSNESEEIEDEDEQSPSQDIETVLKKQQKVDKAQLIFVNNSLLFDIPIKKQGVIKQFRISKQQIVKVNPGWLNAFFGGFFF